jgi:hypothetical protein
MSIIGIEDGKYKVGYAFYVKLLDPLPYHCIHDNIKNCWRNNVALCRAVFGSEGIAVIALLAGDNHDGIPKVA